MTLDLTPYDAADYLKTPEDIQRYLDAAFEDGDPALIAIALGSAARAMGMSDIAREAGVTREALYRSFGPNGNPRLSTLTSVLRALGLKLRVEA